MRGGGLRARALVVHPYLRPNGGGAAVGSWTLQALREAFDVTLLAYERPDVDALNRHFGCALRPADFRLELMAPAWRLTLRALPLRADLLKRSLLSWRARHLLRRDHFAVAISTENELDLEASASLSYVHYPWVARPASEADRTWKHRLPLVSPLYWAVCGLFSDPSAVRRGRQTLLANSRFIAEKTRRLHGLSAQVVYPPTPGGFPKVAWGERRDRLVGLGRIHPVKQWHVAVEAVDRLRAAGLPVELSIIGNVDSPAYAARLDRLAADRPWLTMLRNIPRDRLVREVAACRYGIHPMPDEHFGIAVAELLRAGCLPFVHASGGPLEIVGGAAEPASPTPPRPPNVSQA